MNETEMIGAGLAFLSLRGYRVWRQMNTGSFDAELATKRLLQLMEDQSGQLGEDQIVALLRKCWRKTPGAVRGVADIIGWHLETGKWIAVEVKIGRDKVRMEQHEWLTALKQAGGEVYVCRDFEQFVQSWERRNAK